MHGIPLYFKEFTKEKGRYLSTEEKWHLLGQDIIFTYSFFFFALCHYVFDALRDLVTFVQYKKRQKHPWRSFTLSKLAGFRLVLY